MLSCIDQPMIRREYRSSTAAAYSQPSAVQDVVGDRAVLAQIGSERSLAGRLMRAHKSNVLYNPVSIVAGISSEPAAHAVLAQLQAR
jgi:hypothetical protein